jgi:predicted nucleotidyltransferase
MLDQKEAISKVEQYKKLLMTHIDLEKVYLFGSYAKGTNREDSDINVAIIVDQLDDDYFSSTPFIWKLRHQVDDRIEPILIERRSDPSGFLKEVLMNGIEIK